MRTELKDGSFGVYVSAETKQKLKLLKMQRKWNNPQIVETAINRLYQEMVEGIVPEKLIPEGVREVADEEPGSCARIEYYREGKEAKE